VTEKYDTIIIGSGLGGLSCGSYLAKKGQKVLVLEKNSFYGGYATSYSKGNFTFDPSLHILNDVGKGQYAYKVLEECGVAESIEFQKLKYFGRLIFPEHDIRIPNSGLEGVVDFFEKNFPQEKEGIRALFKEMLAVYDDFFKFLFSSAPMWLQIPMFPFRYRTLYRVMKKTAGQLLDKHLKDDKLKTLLWANWFFYGLPPSKLNVFSVMGNVDFWKGSYLPVGGDQVIANAFVDVIKRNNGHVSLDSEVASITVEHGKALGAITKKGEKYSGENIISNASAVETFHDLVGIEKLPEKFVRRMNKMEPSMSAFLIHLGLDENFKAKLENEEDYLIIVNSTYDLDIDYELHKNCYVEKASFLIGLNSNIARNLGKGNRFVVTITQFQGYDYWRKYEEDYKSGKKLEYDREKERVAKILIKRAEKIVPELSKHIEVLETATPLTLKRYTNNYNGAAYGWANNVNQFTPMDRMTKIPVKNLYLSSACTLPGCGHLGVVASGYWLGKQLVGK
jgi:prolycopene isomerase